MTPDAAIKRARKIARRARCHPKKARRQLIALLCEIARKTGFYRVADRYERLPKKGPRP